MLNSTRIYIIGFMGSGKTTTGMKLAAMLGWSFTDLDKGIEEHTGMTIPEIFSEKGEDYFREVESELLRKLVSFTRIVISTGGGTPVYGDNMDFMLSTGLTLYLKLSPGQLAGRLPGSNEARPLIRDLRDESLLAFIQDKLAYREKWYNRAELTLDGFDANISAIYSEVRARLNI
jgi:shikimate kinase